MKFKLDYKIIYLIALFYITKQMEIYLIVTLSMFLHELGHALMGIIFKMKIQKFEVLFLGFSVSFKLRAIDYSKKIKMATMVAAKKILVASAGPFVNWILIVIGVFIGYNKYTEILVYSNFALLIFNLLPIYPLDGGRILKSIIHIYTGKRKAIRITRNISLTTVLGITIIGSVSIMQYKNISILLITILIWALFLKEEKRYIQRKQIYKMMDIL